MTASGLAASIRGSTESDTFDLGGQTPATVTNNITAAFEDPFPLEEMIRITFVTGAGKLGRQKYDEGCPKAVTSALRELGFEEDRAASCVAECAGLFKLQHDTGKNLKTVVVFPRITGATAAATETSGGGEPGGGGDCVWLQTGTPEELIALSPVGLFSGLVENKLVSWSQKKGCNEKIADLQKLIGDLEARLLEGVVLDDTEQALYDAVSIDDLQEKHKIVKEAMQKQTKDGNLTKEEKQQLLEQVSDRIASLEDELEASQSKPKRAAILTAQKQKAEQRKAMLSKITPKAPAPLLYQPEILVLQKELIPLNQLEDSTKGRLLSVKETKTLARKDEILDEIAQLEQDSRGWFEDATAFAVRLAQSRAAVTKQAKTAAAKKPAKKTSSSSSAWVSSARPKTKSYGAVTKTKKKAASGGVFAAMMMDDSDSD